MFGKRFPLFRLMGFQVHLDVSWFVVALLVTWSLAAGYFPATIPDLSRSSYWIMGVLGTLGLFLSIVFHEFSHSIVARKYGLPMKGITLFLFGGVAEMDEEPQTPKVEFLMAIAGPLASILLAGIFYAVAITGSGLGWPPLANGVLYYLALINGILVLFNMVPAFPLDGGRVLRAALWSWKDNIRWATRISSAIGSGFGLLLIFLGVLRVVYGDLVGGMWSFLIGMFIRAASQGSYRQVMLREALQGEPVRRFMKVEPIAVAPSISLQELVEDYIYRHHHKMFPVVDNARLIGCISTNQVKEVPREEWSLHTVGEVIRPCGRENTIPPDSDALKALTRMTQTGNSRLMVVEGGRLVGIIALKDLADFLALKLDLEGEEAPKAA